jgi:hypothetical protein
MDVVIAKRPKADVAISYPSKDRGRPGAKEPYDDAHSSDVDEVLAAAKNREIP